jgi:hypothetical protein
MVAHVCSPSYSGDRDQEDRISRTAQAKSQRDPISIKKPDVMVCTCHPSYVEGRSRKLVVHASPDTDPT